MPRPRQITIDGFRSISDLVVINFPENQPTVLIGENNSGKSNIELIKIMGKLVLFN